MFLEFCEDFVKPFDVLMKGVRKHNDVVQVHKQYLENVIIEAGLRKPLKCRRAIGQTHGHPVVLKDSKWNCKGSLVSVLLVHSKLIESVC